MKSPITALGFLGIDKEYKLEEIVGEILDSPTKQMATKIQKKGIVAEYYKEFDKDVYMMVRIVVEAKAKETKIEVEQCEPYVDTVNTLEVEEVMVECVDDNYTYYVICEEKETGMQLIFWLQNVVEYLDNEELGYKYNKVHVVGLAMEGTIILPIEKDEDDETFEREEREKLKVILQKIREGDEEARQLLEDEEKELDEQLKERLKEEDFLSIMSGYFIPTTLVDATYAILGEIKHISKRKNNKTNEEMYLFTLNVNDMDLDVMINAKLLVGVPSVGMRFMGTCWLQGTLHMD